MISQTILDYQNYSYKSSAFIYSVCLQTSNAHLKFRFITRGSLRTDFGIYLFLNTEEECWRGNPAVRQYLLCI